MLRGGDKTGPKRPKFFLSPPGKRGQNSLRGGDKNFGQLLLISFFDPTTSFSVIFDTLSKWALKGGSDKIFDFFCRNSSQLISRKSHEVLGWVSLRFFQVICKKLEGGGRFAPPPELAELASGKHSKIMKKLCSRISFFYT